MTIDINAGLLVAVIALAVLAGAVIGYLTAREDVEAEHACAE